MLEPVGGIDNETDGAIVKTRAAHLGFCYESGYALLATDLGGTGVKIELFGEQESSRAVILPPEKAGQCAEWLLKTLGQRGYKLPKDLPDILKRLTRQKNLDKVLKRGDKSKIKQALKVLKADQSEN